MKINFFIIIIILSIQFFGCTGSKTGMFYRAAERADVEIVQGRSGLIRTLYCDLYLEHVDDEGWVFLTKSSVFKGAGKGFPVDPCFHFIIVNTWNKPFEIDKIEVISKDGFAGTEDYNFIKDESYKESRYALSISSLMKKRRLLLERDVLKDIDFQNETVEYRLGFIAPGDRISLFGFFSKFPAGESTKIRVTIKYHDMKKVIDFDMGRFDYKEVENIQQQMGF